MLVIDPEGAGFILFAVHVLLAHLRPGKHPLYWSSLECCSEARAQGSKKSCWKHLVYLSFQQGEDNPQALILFFCLVGPRWKVSAP